MQSPGSATNHCQGVLGTSLALFGVNVAIDTGACFAENPALFFRPLWRVTLANSPQARKRAKQNDKRRLHNASLRSLVRTKIKRVLAAISAGDADASRAAFDEAVPVIDRMANKGIIAKNKAARHKSRLNAKVKALAS